MNAPTSFDIFLVATPGLEAVLAEEARAAGFADATTGQGGVTFRGGWPEVWRSNLTIRGAARILVRIARFRALHLAQLDKRARKVAWAEVLRPDVPFRVEASCRASRIYHSGAAAERVERAIREELGAPAAADAEVVVKVRIDDDLCTLAIDTSGEPLHKRGHKQEVAKAPMRETLAALFLRQMAYTGDESVLDPMCGSGTFVIEAAEIAAGLAPGRSRRFAFERLASFDAAVWARMKEGAQAAATPAGRFYGSDIDPGAIRMARANAERAGVAALTSFEQKSVAELQPTAGPPGLVIVNPPYGGRIGEAADLPALYRALGTAVRRFHGWRVGLITSETRLAEATGLPFKPPAPPVLNGGLRVRLYATGKLA